MSTYLLGAPATRVIKSAGKYAHRQYKKASRQVSARTKMPYKKRARSYSRKRSVSRKPSYKKRSKSFSKRRTKRTKRTSKYKKPMRSYNKKRSSKTLREQVKAIIRQSASKKRFTQYHAPNSSGYVDLTIPSVTTTNYRAGAGTVWLPDGTTLSATHSPVLMDYFPRIAQGVEITERESNQIWLKRFKSLTRVIIRWPAIPDSSFTNMFSQRLICYQILVKFKDLTTMGAWETESNTGTSCPTFLQSVNAHLCNNPVPDDSLLTASGTQQAFNTILAGNKIFTTAALYNTNMFLAPKVLPANRAAKVNERRKSVALKVIKKSIFKRPTANMNSMATAATYPGIVQNMNIKITHRQVKKFVYENSTDVTARTGYLHFTNWRYDIPGHDEDGLTTTRPLVQIVDCQKSMDWVDI